MRALLVGLCLLLAYPSAQANDEAKLEALKQEIQKLQSWLQKAQQESDQLQSDLRQSDIDISKLNQQIEQTRSALMEERDNLKKLRLEQGQLRLHQNKQHQLLAEEVRSAQRLGRDGPIKLLLNQNSPQQAQRMLKYFAYFNQARIERIEEILKELERLDNIAAEIAQSEQRLQQYHDKQQQDQRLIQQQKQRQQQLLSQLKQRMGNEQKNLETKQANRKQLENLLAEVQTLLDSGPRSTDARPINQLKGKLPMPIKGRILQAFGGSKNIGYNKGWLIAAQSGEYIRAVHHGRIVFADWLRGYGLVLILDHGQGYLTLYAHNQSLLRDVGSWVNHNDIIATAGNSGGIEQAALYFEIRHRGNAQDPAIWLKR